ncbi:MAG: GTP 3',8-cyclase MoaA [Candidatus Methanospirareceae archaeon]
MNAHEKMEKNVLVDDYGRVITSLRFSVTRRCNLNCIYCHKEGEKGIIGGGGKEISAEEIIAIAKVASSRFNVKKVKLSGGEPLIRGDIVDIVQGLSAFEEDISLTTNGVLLQKYASDLRDAGLKRVNISLDSLREERYDLITKSRNKFKKVIEGIESAISAGLAPIKLNMVVLKGINEDEIFDMVEFAREKGLILQLIELIDFFDSSINNYKVDFTEIERKIRAKASEVKVRGMHRRKKYIVDGAEIEIVRPMDNTEFCANCKRLRITSGGKIKPCLLRNDNLIPIESLDEEHIAERMKEAMKYREPFFKPLSLSSKYNENRRERDSNFTHYPIEH